RPQILLPLLGARLISSFIPHPSSFPRWLWAILALVTAMAPCMAADSAAERDRQADAFLAGPVTTFKITLGRKEALQLRQEPREYVPATVQVGTTVYTNVGIHLKGAAGSFRDLGDRPALTLNFDKFVKGQHCFGLDKLHLNNSVQDESYLCESIGSAQYRQAGVPTARASHAFVQLNGRDLGLYVLKEGYDGQFLRRNFPGSGKNPGNLYDGGFLQDVNQQLKRDAGKGPEDYSDLRGLLRAASAPVSRRAQELERVLDVDRFLTFLALQALTDDWDGYGRNRNNYRLYFDTAAGRAIFIPHGMDQLFREANGSVQPFWSGLIARRVAEVPELQTRYDARLRSLLERQFTWNWITNHFAAVDARLQPALANRSPEDRQEWAAQLRRQSNRLAVRIRNVRRQLDLPPDPSLASATVALRTPQRLDGWAPRPQQGRSSLDVDTNAPPALHLTAHRSGTSASFRTSRSLPAGAYTFEARARTRSVESQAGMPGRGAGIRISGADRQHHLVGDSDWTPVKFEFELDDDREVEFIVELRADRGEAWFDLSSIRLSGRAP
ncbi:MAG: CotH kinase family protein, partial [Verrucomicrobiae bacterium]|nr:CotH kinase family protein [Verrucomicrobiae bacterium]